MSLLIALILCLFAVSPAHAQTGPNVSVNPSTQHVSPGDTVTVTLNATNVTNLGAYQFSLGFDPAILEAVSVTNATFLTSTGRTALPLSPTINNTTGSLTYGVITLSSPTPGPTGSGVLATVTFTAKTAGIANLTLSGTSLTDPSANPLIHTTSNGSVTVDAPASPTPTPTQSPSGNTTISFLQTGDILVNQPFNVDVVFSTSATVSGVDAIITFDPAKLQVSSFTDNHLLPVTPLIDFNNPTGRLRLSELTNPGTPYTGQGSLATITFTPIATGDSTVSFVFTPGSKADTNAISSTTGQDILETPTNLNLGILNPADLQLQLLTPSDLGHVVTGNLTVLDSTFSAQMTTNASGSSNLARLPSAFIGTLKTFFFKVSGFLRERFDLTAVTGLNSVNLGLLKAGDLDNNGIINTVDLSLLYDQWFNAGSADFNQDGVVNSADHWVLLQNYLSEDE